MVAMVGEIAGWSHRESIQAGVDLPPRPSKRSAWVKYALVWQSGGGIDSGASNWVGAVWAAVDVDLFQFLRWERGELYHKIEQFVKFIGTSKANIHCFLLSSNSSIQRGWREGKKMVGRKRWLVVWFGKRIVKGSGLAVSCWGISRGSLSLSPLS